MAGVTASIPKPPTDGAFGVFRESHFRLLTFVGKFGQTKGGLSKKAAKVWDEMSDAEKEPWQTKFESHRAAYAEQKQKQKYVRRPPVKKQKRSDDAKLAPPSAKQKKHDRAHQAAASVRSAVLLPVDKQKSDDVKLAPPNAKQRKHDPAHQAAASVRSDVLLPDAMVKFAPGSSVRVKGLLQASDLNGMTGVLIAYDESSRRWRVDLGAGSTKAVRPENLICADLPPRKRQFDHIGE